METNKGGNLAADLGRKKIIDRRDIELAIKNSMSNKGAARYLGIAYNTYKSIAIKLFNEKGDNLFYLHKNAAGKGVPKYANRKSKGVPLMDLLEGRVDSTFVSVNEIKARIIAEGYMKEECSKCEYHEKRALDHKVPLIIYYVDGNKKNWRLENLEFLCYNCYFIHVADVFSKNQIEMMQDFKVLQAKKIDLDLPRMYREPVKKSINLENEYVTHIEDRPDDFGEDLIVSVKPKR